MKVLTLLPLLYVHSVLAAPASDAQIVLGETAAVAHPFGEGLVSAEENDVSTTIHKFEDVSYDDKAETWSEKGREFVKQNGLVCTSFHFPGVPSAQFARS